MEYVSSREGKLLNGWKITDSRLHIDVMGGEFMQISEKEYPSVTTPDIIKYPFISSSR